MKKLSLLWVLSAVMFMFSCGEGEETTEGTEEEVATTEVVSDHECCSAECGDDCEAHAEEKKTCENKCNISKCDKSNCNKSQCNMDKCDGSSCDEACTVDHVESDGSSEEADA